MEQNYQAITLDQLAPELHKAYARVPSIPLHKGWVRKLARFAQSVMPVPKVPGARIETVSRRGVRMRIYHPLAAASPAALLWVHGGGYLIGQPSQNDGLCAEAAVKLGITVFAPSYRLAPEHPFPAPLADVFAAWQWLAREAPARGIDPARIAIGGESAGGGLAAVLCQRIHDSGGPQPAGQWLFCPMLDDRTASQHERDGQGHLLWNNRLNAAGWRAYLGAEPGGEAVPEGAVAARRADLRGLPPTWIGIGDLDLFVDEARAYAARLRQAGVAVVYDEAAGAPHAFATLAPDARVAQAHRLAAQRWLAGVLGLPVPADVTA